MLGLYVNVVVILVSSVFHCALATANCTSGTTLCSPRATCCPSGTICNVNRGIPVCEDLKYPIISGFDDPRCTDPYLFDCSSLVGIGGFCCPIGSICLNNGVDKVVSCIDAYGASASAFPSTTTGFIPQTTLIGNNNAAVVFNPPDAWSSPSSIPNCTANNVVHATNTSNATISFNYTGPSIMIRTVKSPQGGVFSMFLDGVLLKDIIDTFNADGELCYAVQFPPFINPPPGFGSSNNHSITLMYGGPSKKAPNGTTSGSVQFDSFAIPKFKSSEFTPTTSSATRSCCSSLLGTFLLLTVVFLWADLGVSL